MTIDLLPCPFCGGEAQTQKYVTESLFSHAQVEFTQVGCHDCGVSFESEQDGNDGAIAAWNRRSPAPAPSTDRCMTIDLEALKDALLLWESTEEQHEAAHSAQDAYIEMLVEAAPAMIATIQAQAERVRVLEEESERKSAALAKACEWFTDYARQREAKTPPDTAKAGTNWERAHYCDTAAHDDGEPSGCADDELWADVPVESLRAALGDKS